MVEVNDGGQTGFIEQSKPKYDVDASSIYVREHACIDCYWADTTLYVVFGLAAVVSNRRISWGCGKSMIRPFAKRLVS
jgi:hypothetical protein